MIMRQNLGKVEKLYDMVAEEYAAAFASEHEKKPKDREMLLRFSQELGDRRPVCDVGCGPGQTAGYLKNLGIEISGLDLSERALEQASTRHPEIPFRKGNILDLAFESDSIAGVVAFYAIVHFTEEQVRMALREIFRVLQPGGQVLFTYHVGEETIHVDEFFGKKVDIELMFSTSAFIFGCVTDTGFENIDIIEREPYPGVEYQSRRAYVFASKPIARKLS